MASYGLSIAELNIEDPIICRAPTSRPKISYSVAMIPNENFEAGATAMTIQLTSNLVPTSRAIVFAANLKECERLSTALGCHQYHAKLQDKKEQLTSWLAGSSSRIMVTTL